MINGPAFAEIPVERTGIPLYRDGTKNVQANILSIKMERDKYERYTCIARSRLTSRLGKRPTGRRMSPFIRESFV